MSEAFSLSRDAARKGGEVSRAGAVYTSAPSLVMMGHAHEAAAEAIRAVRTYIIAQHMLEGRRALAVCAASSGSGCTFTATNLAVSLSQMGAKTLLIDGDMRRPTVHLMIRPPKLLGGLRHCLSSPGASFAEGIETDVFPNLSVMYSGGAAPNPQELLSTDRFKDLMDHCMREHDVTIVDTPPANTCSDARRISTVCGYSLIVARRHQTFVKDIETLTAQLRGDHAVVLGSVLTGA